jgi:hypothetical protein
MISPTILAAAAKVAEHSARRSTPGGVSDAPSVEQRVLGAPVLDSQDPDAAVECLPMLAREPRDAFDRRRRRQPSMP